MIPFHIFKTLPLRFLLRELHLMVDAAPFIYFPSFFTVL